MPFSPTSQAPVEKLYNGTRCLVWNFTTAEGGTATETELTGAPIFGRIVRVQQSRTSGTGANHQPKIATAAAGSGVDLKYQATSTAVATNIDDPGTTGQPIPYYASGGSLFYQEGWDAGADNVAEIEVVVAAGLV